MSIFEGTLELKNPLTKECWDKLADVELENTERIWFTTPSEKRVDYIKADVLDKIRTEIEQNAYPIVHGVNNHEKGMTLYGILQVIDKYKESEAEK